VSITLKTLTGAATAEGAIASVVTYGNSPSIYVSYVPSTGVLTMIQIDKNTVEVPTKSYLSMVTTEIYSSSLDVGSYALSVPATDGNLNVLVNSTLVTT
jgi:acetaldehyde dehydrogenase (acetylating)